MKWIKITSKTNKLEKNNIYWVMNDNNMHLAYYDNQGKWFNCPLFFNENGKIFPYDIVYELKNVTHWQPIPKPINKPKNYNFLSSSLENNGW